MYCTSCGNKLADGVKFCTKCGARTDGEGSAAAVAVAPAHATGFIGRFFGGRLARMRYFEGGLFAFLPLFVLVSLWGIIELMSNATSGSSDQSGWLFGILVALAVVFFFFLHLSVAVRRCHDFGYSGWLSLCAFIPYIGVIFALIFLFKKGDAEANKYGLPPVQRSFLEDVFVYKK